MIKKIMSFMMLMAAVSFTACINDEDVIDDASNNPIENENSNVSFEFVVPQVGGDMRSAETSGVLEAGSKEEYALKNARIYLFNAESDNFYKSYEVNNGDIKEPVVDGTSVTYNKVSYRINPGTYKVFVIANADYTLAPATVSDLLSKIDGMTYNKTNIDILNKGIIMTNRGAQAPTVTVNPDKHTTVTIMLERVLAKIALSKTQDSWELKDNEGSVYATITPSNYNMVNLSKDYYLFRHVGQFDNADETPAAPQSWDNIANFGVIADGNGYAMDPHFFEKTVAGAANFDGSIFNNPLKNSANPDFSYPGTFNTPGKYASIYCLGNTNFISAQLQAYTTGIQIAANMTIATSHCWNADGSNINMDETQAPSELYYFNYDFYRDLDAVAKVGKANVPTDPNISDADLWKKYQIKRFRTHQGSYKCFYNYWIKHLDNGAPTTLGVMEYGIVRNNIYKVNVTDVLGLGDGTPNVDPVIPVEKQGYLDVDFGVMPWIVRGQDAPLGD